MDTSQNIAKRIKIVAKERKTPLKVMLYECDLGINTISDLSKGKQISYANFAKIADYLDCSVDYLLGRTNQKEEKPIPGNGDELSAEQAELLGKFARLTPEEQREVLSIIDYKLSQKPPRSSGQEQEAM